MYPFGLTFNTYQREGALENKYKFNGKERDTELGLNWDAFGARMYDSELARFHTLDPKAEIYNTWSPYLYAANDPIRLIDKNGEGPGDAIIGFLVAVTDNYTGVNLRDKYRPSSPQAAKDYNNGQNVGDIGTFLVGSDVAATSGGVAVVSTTTGQLEVAAPAAAVSIWNGVAAGRGLVNLANQKGRVNAEGSSSNSEPPKRSKNRLPDKGEPNTTATNAPGTTTKKYGPDGNVQKEFNQGHQGNNVPKQERSPHVHDYKPNPNNPSGRGERQPGRPPKRNELKKDFDQ
ncbi:RHS repeat-associated core domain-containing protein [Cesiribacter sp. SM1]|uniref:RHS repeat-associated core domain-containing protein n=1 Tax=Cesiribacter sp. SM1 TaxID=2861196 RepID=UPI001CD6C1E0|nr:RHS repeat-associated core domain-containing protein [Cesiribacter sp. SM1]